MGAARRKREQVELWCERMAARFGPTVKDSTGREWTWRHALWREATGRMDMDKNGPPSTPTNFEREVAAAWEAGFWPKWAVRPTPLVAVSGGE